MPPAPIDTSDAPSGESLTWAGVPLQPAGTLHGDLQRRLGRAALAAGREPGAGALVLDCVCDDPRLDGQVEDAPLYYADLLLQLHVSVEPLRAFLAVADAEDQQVHPDFQPGNVGGWKVSLCLRTLGMMATRGDDPARRLLRDHVAGGASWMQALHALNEDPHPDAVGDGLVHTVLSRAGDTPLRRFVEREHPWLGWAAEAPAVKNALDTLADEDAWHAARPPSTQPLQSADLTTMTTAQLLTWIRPQGDAQAAGRELGRRGDLTAVLALYDASAAGPTPAFPVRRALLAGLRALPLEQALPLLRAWIQDDPASEQGTLALLVLKDIAQPADEPLVMRALRELLALSEWGQAVAAVQALTRLQAFATPVMTWIWANTQYSYLRQRVLGHLLVTDPPALAVLAEEGLWDADEVVRQRSAEAVPLREPFIARLSQLAADPLEETEVVDVARRRLAEQAEGA